MRIALALAACAAIAVALIVLPISAKEDGPPNMTKPIYNDDGALVLPVGYEDWVFVGASMGLSYDENLNRAGQGPGLFHHVYIQPEAYEQYKAEGTFPEKTMLVMENYSASSKVNPNLHGHFADKRVGLEVALKDKETYEDGWAYFNFSARDGIRPKAKAFPKAVCFDCHAEHAKDDNVFVQFYPILKREMVKQGRWVDDEDSHAEPKKEEKYEAK